MHKTKQDVVDEIISARADLLDAIDGLPPDARRKPFAVGKWSVKDVLAHITAWESELVTALNQAQNNRTPHIAQIDDIDQWNEEQYHHNARRSLEAILVDLEGVHHMLLKMVREYNEQALTDNRQYRWMEGEPLSYLIAENSSLHEREHADDIRRWRENEGH